MLSSGDRGGHAVSYFAGTRNALSCWKYIICRIHCTDTIRKKLTTLQHSITLVKDFELHSNNIQIENRVVQYTVKRKEFTLAF